MHEICQWNGVLLTKSDLVSEEELEQAKRLESKVVTLQLSQDWAQRLKNSGFLFWAYLFLMVEGKSMGNEDGEGFLILNVETYIEESREEIIKGTLVSTQL